MRLKAFGAAALLSSAAFLPLPAYAGTYQAICNGARCSLSVTDQEITSPAGSIPTSRVTYWGGGGESKTDVGMGVGGLLLFGLPGALGFLAKNHDYNFTVTGFDQEGRSVAMNIRFVNDKPARRLMGELAAVTGLGMNQRRSIAEIKRNEAIAAARLREEWGSEGAQPPVALESGPAVMPAASELAPVANYGNILPPMPQAPVGALGPMTVRGDSTGSAAVIDPTEIGEFTWEDDEDV